MPCIRPPPRPGRSCFCTTKTIDKHQNARSGFTPCDGTNTWRRNHSRGLGVSHHTCTRHPVVNPIGTHTCIRGYRGVRVNHDGCWYHPLFRLPTSKFVRADNHAIFRAVLLPQIHSTIRDPEHTRHDILPPWPKERSINQPCYTRISKPFSSLRGLRDCKSRVWSGVMIVCATHLSTE